MFTGLIETTGIIKSLWHRDQGITLGIAPQLSGFSTILGASIAVDGVCLTVESMAGGIVFFTAVAETVARTTLSQKAVGAMVNLERALLAGGRFEGHIVQGHVDGVGTITGDERIGKSLQRTIAVSPELMPLLAEKGSVALDGISLTIASLSSSSITIALIPYTLANTSMEHKKTGDRVNIECDVIARYLARLLAVKTDAVQGSSATLMEKLERYGF